MASLEDRVGLERFCFVISGLSKDKKEHITAKLKENGASVSAMLLKTKVRFSFVKE